MGHQGEQGRLQTRYAGKDVCCSDNEIIIDLRNKADEWSKYILKYDQGVNFLKIIFMLKEVERVIINTYETKKFSRNRELVK